MTMSPRLSVGARNWLPQAVKERPLTGPSMTQGATMSGKPGPDNLRPRHPAPRGVEHQDSEAVHLAPALAAYDVSDMINAQNLLERFINQGTSVPPAQASQASTSTWTNPAASGASSNVAGLARQALNTAGGLQGLAVSGVAGGLLGLLVGDKKKKNRGGLGGALSHGGAAMLGALASQAYQNWRSGQAPAQAPFASPQQATALEPRFLPAAAPASDGQPFELALIRAMVAAAKADGHIDTEEQRRIFARVEQVGLDAESKAFIFDALASPIGVSEVAAFAMTQEQAAELYLVSRLTVEPDEPTERAYLEALAHRLKLPTELVAHLNRQAEAA